MSADNWDVCPQCNINDTKDYEAQVRKVADSYGKVAPEEYMKNVEALKTPKKVEYTLREDYEIGINDGEFYVRYTGHCKICGFRHEYKLDQPITLK